jgi:hypothetical protein
MESMFLHGRQKLTVMPMFPETIKSSIRLYVGRSALCGALGGR